jgi:hypothetical protein
MVRLLHAGIVGLGVAPLLDGLLQPDSDLAGKGFPLEAHVGLAMG